MRKTKRQNPPKRAAEKSPRTPSKPSPKTPAPARPAKRTPKSPTASATAAPPRRSPSARNTSAKRGEPSDFEYDVCTSFAGENRDFVAQVVTSLKRRRIRCFYDFDEQATLLGKNLFTYLDDVYRKKARFCVMFISKHYPVKLWTNHERQSIQARMFESSEEYLIPVRLDDTEVPGVLKTIGYIDGRRHSPADVAALIQAKVQGKRAVLNTPAAPSSPPASPGKKRKDPAIDTPTAETGGRRKVTTSGRWILLGDAYFEAALVVKEKDSLRVQIAPKTTREEAELRALEAQPRWHRDKLPFAHGNDAARCQVEDVSSRSENGKIVYSLLLQPERDRSHPFEVTLNKLSADQIAEKRARLILLNEQPATGDTFQNQHIVRGFGNDGHEPGVIGKILRKLGGSLSLSNLQKARLAAIYQLTASGIIEHVLEFSLGPGTKAGLPLHFEGRRPASGHSTAHVIRISGSVPFTAAELNDHA